uniref:Uncharacterized protein n=1 Tax=Rhizophora mucronata TaxID=61149 RepID=A0A2P2NUP4_RHIMU
MCDHNLSQKMARKYNVSHKHMKTMQVHTSL